MAVKKDYKCPFRKEIIKSEIKGDGSQVTTVNFLSCYQALCPFWNSYNYKCEIKLKKN